MVWFYIFEALNSIFTQNFINYQMKNLSPSKTGFLNKFQTFQQSPYQGNHVLQPVDTTPYSDILYQPKNKRKLECYKMSVDKKFYKNFLEVHQWRCKTSLPIVKSYYIDIIDDHTQLICLESYHQYIPQRLESIFNIPLIQGLYLIKQSLIGFERLLEKFGGFYPTDKMIGINQNNKCKVWINECFNENKFNPSNIQENQFCTKVLGIIRNHLVDSQTVDILWQRFFQKPTFISIFKIVEKFAAENKYKIPNKFQVNFTEKNNDLSTITNSSMIFSKRSMNSVASTIKFKDSSRSQHQEKKIQSNSPNKESTDKTLSARQKYPKSNFSIFPIKIKTQSDIYQASTPQDTYQSSPKTPKTPKTPLRYFQYQHRNKSGSMYRSSDIDLAFLQSKKSDYIPQKQRKYSANDTTKLIPNQNTTKNKKRKFQSNQDFNQQSLNANPLLQKHGWEKKIDNLMSVGNIKQSIIEGNDPPISDSMIRCQKLDVFTNQLVRSMLPSDLQVIPDDIYL